MIYGSGSLEKDRLRLDKKDTEKIFLARMADNEGSYRLFVTAVNIAVAKYDLDVWCRKQPDNDRVVSVDPYDIDAGVFL